MTVAQLGYLTGSFHNKMYQEEQYVRGNGEGRMDGEKGRRIRRKREGRKNRGIEEERWKGGERGGE